MTKVGATEQIADHPLSETSEGSDRDVLCEIIRRPGLNDDKLCHEGQHPAKFISIKSCGCRTLICQMALNRILSSFVHNHPLECQHCGAHQIGLSDWYPL